MTPKRALASRWQLKTVVSARSIPFDLTLRVELCIDRFANRSDGQALCRSTVTHQLQESTEQTDLTGCIYPPRLRATVPSPYVEKGVVQVPVGH